MRKDGSKVKGGRYVIKGGRISAAPNADPDRDPDPDQAPDKGKTRPPAKPRGEQQDHPDKERSS